MTLGELEQGREGAAQFVLVVECLLGATVLPLPAHLEEGAHHGFETLTLFSAPGCR